MLAFGQFAIFLALSANINVFIVSSEFSVSGEILAKSIVLVLPPMASYKNVVNFESRYGMCFASFAND